MLKTIAIIVVLVAGISYYNDSSALTPWVKTAGDLGVITAKTVKGTGQAIHRITRENDGIINTVSNAAEDTVYSIKN
jgi:hypothetical protein